MRSKTHPQNPIAPVCLCLTINLTAGVQTWNILVGILASFLSGLIFSRTFQDLFLRMQRRISWNTFIKALTDSRVLRDLDRIAPDLIIGLNDGIVPGAILARNLQINDLV
jgi:hypothetical protein